MRFGATPRAGPRRDAKTPALAWQRFIPLLFRQGEAYQFDWSHEDVEIAGKLYEHTSVIITADRGAGFNAYLWSDNGSEFIATAVQK